MITPEQLASSGTEASHQKALMCWAAISKYPELRFLAHIPNGGTRNIREAANLKAQGVRRGIPDLMLPVARGSYHGLFIEMKIKSGVVSEYQQEWLAFLNQGGYKAVVCYSWIAARDEIIKYLEEK